MGNGLGLPIAYGIIKKHPHQLVAAGETLLVAEDEDIVRHYLKKILVGAGYRVILAGNGNEAVGLFRENNDISLVLSDVVMPGINGGEVRDAIRMMKADIKVLFMSGYAADLMQKKGIFEERTDFIMKPFNKNVLLQKVRELLDRG